MIKHAINAQYESMEDELYKGKKSAITSDDLSNAVEKVLPDILKLSRLPGPDSAKLAWDLVLYAADHTFVEESCGYGDRGFDTPADLLLERLAPQRRAQDVSWAYEEDIGRMKEMKANVGGFGVGEDWFVWTLKLMNGWIVEDGGQPVEADPVPEEFDDDPEESEDDLERSDSDSDEQ